MLFRKVPNYRTTCHYRILIILIVPNCKKSWNNRATIALSYIWQHSSYNTNPTNQETPSDLIWGGVSCQIEGGYAAPFKHWWRACKLFNLEDRISFLTERLCRSQPPQTFEWSKLSNWRGRGGTTPPSNNLRREFSPAPVSMAPRRICK